MKSLFSFLLIHLLCSTAAAQISGNQAYRDRYSSNRNYDIDGETRSVFVKDSLLYVSADILFNAAADSMLVMLGLNEEAPTIKTANENMNKRIAGFRNGLRTIGVGDKHSYVDFITQTKIYDYRINGNTATQFIKGFEIKKNIIVRIAATQMFDKVIELASENGIYDVIKVDYIVSDQQRIYEEMLAAAATVIRQKKAGYLRLSPAAVSETGKIVTENFYAVYPNTQYQNYEAFETSDVTTSTENIVLYKKQQRTNKTFYYEKIDQSNFDQIIHNSTPVVGVQYVLKLQMQYDLKKP